MRDFELADHESREERIRRLAFELWQIDGGPADRSDHYWFQAAELVDEWLTGDSHQAPVAAISAASAPLPGEQTEPRWKIGVREI